MDVSVAQVYDERKRNAYLFLKQLEKELNSAVPTPSELRIGIRKTVAEAKNDNERAHLRQPESAGGGNHRGSIFRLIVGTALINKGQLNFPTWGIGNNANRIVRDGEVNLERKVSEVIGNMLFIWLAIEDESGPDSRRGYVERNSIALLSNYSKTPLDPPSGTWLGHFCNRERVKKSGLWNQNHVEESYDPAFLDYLQALVADTKTAA